MTDEPSDSDPEDSDEEEEDSFEELIEQSIPEWVSEVETTRSTSSIGTLNETDIHFIRTGYVQTKSQSPRDIQNRIEEKYQKLPERINQLFEDVALFLLYSQEYADATLETPSAAIYDGLFSRMNEVQPDDPSLISTTEQFQTYQLGVNVGTMLDHMIDSPVDPSLPQDDERLEVLLGVIYEFLGIDSTTVAEKTIENLCSILERDYRNRANYEHEISALFEARRERYTDDRTEEVIIDCLQEYGLYPDEFLIDRIRQMVSEDFEQTREQIDTCCQIVADCVDPEAHMNFQKSIRADIDTIIENSETKYQGVFLKDNLEFLFYADGQVTKETIAKTLYNTLRYTDGVVASFNRCSTDERGTCWTEYSIVKRDNNGFSLTPYGQLVAEVLFNEQITVGIISTLMIMPANEIDNFQDTCLWDINQILESVLDSNDFTE